LPGAELRQHEPLEYGATLADGAQPVAFASQIFPDNRVQRVAFGALGLTALGERVPTLGNAPTTAFASLRASLSVSPFFRCMRLERPPVRYCTTKLWCLLGVTMRPKPGKAKSQ
jgi:hypothetical protein